MDTSISGESFGVFLGPKGLLVGVILVFLGLTWFISIRISRYFTFNEIYEDPTLFNLTESQVPWDVYYGKSPVCGVMDCFARSDWPKENYQKQMVLPAREFPLKDYKPGDMIYLRTRVEIPEKLMVSGAPLALHSVYIYAKKYQFYLNDQLVAEGPSELFNIPLPRDLIPANRTINMAFVINADGLNSQGIANRYALLIGSKATLGKKAFLADEMLTTFYLWFLLPKIIFCIIFSLVYLFVTPSLAMFCFIFYAFLGSLDTFMYSGFAVEMLNLSIKYDAYGNLFRMLSVPFLIGFLWERLGTGKNQTLKRVFVTVLSIITVFATTQNFWNHEKSFHFWRISHALVYLSSLAYGAYLSRAKKQSGIDRSLAIFFAISILPAGLRLFHVISDWLGLNLHMGVSWHWIHELVMFVVLTALAIIDVGRSLSTKAILEKELAANDERMELAQSVQRMLLPREFSGQNKNIDYQFFYEPAEKMSGDWFHCWDSPQATHLLMGDVVGKGPQAALTVSVVASIVNECKIEGKEIDECIEKINKHLIAFFNRTITTTLTVVSLRQDRRIELINAGTIGWMTMIGDKVEYHPLRSGILGHRETLNLGRVVLEVGDDFTLMTFTDGVLEGSRALKNLRQKLLAEKSRHPSFEGLFRLVVSCGLSSVLVDDKTLLVVGSKRAVREGLSAYPPEESVVSRAL